MTGTNIIREVIFDTLHQDIHVLSHLHQCIHMILLAPYIASIPNLLEPSKLPELLTKSIYSNSVPLKYTLHSTQGSTLCYHIGTATKH